MYDPLPENIDPDFVVNDKLAVDVVNARLIEAFRFIDSNTGLNGRSLEGGERAQFALQIYELYENESAIINDAGEADPD